MSIENFNQLLAEFGSGIGLKELTADQDGYCSLLVDDDHTLHLKYDDDTESFRFFMELGTLPEESRQQMSADILDANVMYRGTGGCVLGVDALSKKLTICFDERLAGTDQPRFENLLHGFLNNAQAWRQKIRTEYTDSRAARQGDMDHTAARLGSFALRV